MRIVDQSGTDRPGDFRLSKFAGDALSPQATRREAEAILTPPGLSLLVQLERPVSAALVAAGALGFLIFSQTFDGPER